MSGTADNRCVCGFAIALPKPLPLVGASHTPQTLYAIGFGVINLKTKCFINFNIILKGGQGEARWIRGSRRSCPGTNRQSKKLKKKRR